MPKRELQFEREEYLKLLEGRLNYFKHGDAKNIAVLGAPKTGKTYLLKHILKSAKWAASVYVDIEKIGLSPESFSIEFIGAVCFNILDGRKEDYRKFLDINYLMTFEGRLSANAFSIIKSVHNEILKIKPDQRLLVKEAFRFLESIAHSQKFIAVLDNFEILFDLNNFPQIKDISSLVEFGRKNIMYIGMSSASYSIKENFRDFELIEIKNFTLAETGLFIKKNFPSEAKNSEKIHSLSNGNPYAVISLLERNSEIKNIEKTFITELLCKSGSLYCYCKDNLNVFLSRTNGQTLSKIILRVIAFNGGLRLSEIAARIYRSAPVTKSLLERLIASDIIYRKDNRYFFHDSVLGLWIKLTSSGYEFDNGLSEEEFREVLKLL